MADKEFTQICKEILGIGKRLEKIEPDELRKIKADIEQISATIATHKASFDANKEDFDGKYSGITEIINTFDTLKAQIEEVLKSGVINDDTKGLISTYSSKKIMDLLNEVKGVIDEKFSTIHKNGITPWSSTLEYPAGAISVLNGKLYQAKSDNTNKNPSENKGIWHVIASEEWCKQTCLKIGDYGIGGLDNMPMLRNIDDTTTPTGFYRAVENQTSGTFPQPYGGSRHAHVLIERVDTNWIKQTIVQISQDGTKPIFYRTNNLNRGWHPWKEVVTGTKDAAATANTIVQRDANGDFAGRWITADHFKLRTQQQNNLFGESSEILFRGGASEDANYVRAVSSTYMLKALLSARGDGIFFEGLNEDKGVSGRVSFGYVRLPGGVILQFGVSHRMNPWETREQYFPVAFPTHCLCVLVSAHMPIPNDGINAAQTNLYDNAKFVMQNCDVNSSMHIAWMAIGV